MDIQHVKKNNRIRNILIILIFSIIIMIPVIINFNYVGHDFEFHYLNIKEIMSKLSLTNLFVYEPLSNLANGFGYGTRFFYPALPHLLSSIMGKLLFNSPMLGIKVTEWFTIFLSGIAFYLLCKKLFKRDSISVIGACFYMASPYHISEMSIRDALSEIFIFIAIPLIILGLLELLDGNKKHFYLYFILGYVIACYSHVAMTIYFTLLFIIPFVIIYHKKIFHKETLLNILYAALIILVLISPIIYSLLKMKLFGNYAIFYSYYTTAKGALINSTLSFTDLFKIKPHTYNGIRHEFHLIVLIPLIISLIYFFIHRKYKSDANYLFFIVSFIISCIMVTKLFPWQIMPSFLGTLQFPWRLTLYVQFFGILVALYYLNNFNISKVKVLIIIGLIILSSFYTTYHLDKQVDLENINMELGMGNEYEYLPYNTILNFDYFESRSHDIIADKDITIDILEDDVPTLVFQINDISDETVIELPRLYYPGYVLYCDDDKVNIYENGNGFIEAKINTNGKYVLKYSAI